MKKWLIVLVLAGGIAAAAVFAWPRSVPRRFVLCNGTDSKVCVTAERDGPTYQKDQRRIRSHGRQTVTYRFSEEEAARARQHRIALTVDSIAGRFITRGEFLGSEIYGRELIIRTGGITVAEPPE